MAISRSELDRLWVEIQKAKRIVEGELFKGKWLGVPGFLPDVFLAEIASSKTVVGPVRDSVPGKQIKVYTVRILYGPDKAVLTWPTFPGGQPEGWGPPGTPVEVDGVLVADDEIATLPPNARGCLFRQPNQTLIFQPFAPYLADQMALASHAHMDDYDCGYKVQAFTGPV